MARFPGAATSLNMVVVGGMVWAVREMLNSGTVLPLFHPQQLVSSFIPPSLPGFLLSLLARVDLD